MKIILVLFRSFFSFLSFLSFIVRLFGLFNFIVLGILFLSTATVFRCSFVKRRNWFWTVIRYSVVELAANKCCVL